MKLGVQELMIILLIVLIIFGPSQLPKLMKMVGQGVKSFKDGLSDNDDQDSSKKMHE